MLKTLEALSSVDLWEVVQDGQDKRGVTPQEHPEDALLLEPLCAVEAVLQIISLSPHQVEDYENSRPKDEESFSFLDRLDDRIFRLPMGIEISPEFLATLCEHIEDAGCSCHFHGTSKMPRFSWQDAFFGPGQASF